MIYDEAYFELLEKSRKVGQRLRRHPAYLNYQAAKKAFAADAAVQAEIAMFGRAKEKWEEQRTFARYRPEIAKQQQTLQSQKARLDQYPSVAALHQAEFALQKVLDEVAEQIAQTVSEKVRVDHGNPFSAAKHSCGGNHGKRNC